MKKGMKSSLMDAATISAYCTSIVNSKMKLSMGPRDGGIRVAIYLASNQRLLAEGFHETSLVAALEAAYTNLREQFVPEAV